jgi:hypothetical protein
MAEPTNERPSDSSRIRSTPGTPAELAAIQRDDESRLIYGVDLSIKARALAMYAEELELCIHDLISLAYVQLIRAEGGIDAAIKAEIQRGSHTDLNQVASWSCTSGGLMSIRMTLRAMLETPVDPGLWRFQ